MHKDENNTFEADIKDRGRAKNVEELRERLQKRIAELRAKRGATEDDDNSGPKNKRVSKQSKKPPKKKQRVKAKDEEKKKAEGQKKQPNVEKKQPIAVKKSQGNEPNLQFSSFDFSSKKPVPTHLERKRKHESNKVLLEKVSICFFIFTFAS